MECCTGLSLVPRAVVTVCRDVSTIFRQCDGYDTHSYVFWDADSESGIKSFEFEEKMTARMIWKFSITMGDPKFKIW